MKLKKLTRVTTTIIAVAVILSSCNGGGSKGTNGQTTGDSTNVNKISQDVKSVVYPLPTPFEMTKMLNEIGAKYVAASLNPANKVEKYFTEKSKAINLGVYGADLAYAATYDQKQDVKVYSSAVKTLVDQLGINIDYSAFLSDKFKEKANNKDTLSQIITNTFFDTYKFLSEKGNPDHAIMMVSGMWVELMYIATNISDDTYHFSGMVNLIVKQKDSYGKLMGLLAQHNSNPDIKSLESQLGVLKPAFAKEASGLSQQDYVLILKTIKSIRQSLVS
jgi:hypothetical protein